MYMSGRYINDHSKRNCLYYCLADNAGVFQRLELGGSIMEKVFIVVEKIAYEGDTVVRVFANYKDAVAYADELTAALELPLDIDYVVLDSEVY